MIAGCLELDGVMGALAGQRPVFHSEADFQFAFAQATRDQDPSISIRFERPQPGDRRTYVDLVCSGESETLIEFKYITRAWSGIDAGTGEPYGLRTQAALDLARFHFIHDVTRLEGWAHDQPGVNGYAVLLTNDSRLWEPPKISRPTRDESFRLHEGRTLTGELRWGTAEKPFEPNRRTLRSSYDAAWKSYSQIDDAPGGTLKWLGWHVRPDPASQERAGGGEP